MGYSFITDIEKLNNDLPQLTPNFSELGIFASSFELNGTIEKYFKCVSIGECTPIAYEQTDAMQAFIRHIIRVACKGQDFQKSPLMRLSKDFVGCKSLVYSSSDAFNDFEETTVKNLSKNLSTEEFIKLLLDDISKTTAKIVIIEDGENLAINNCQSLFAELNKIALNNNIFVLFGIDITKSSQSTNEYLVNHTHNLCRLTQEILETSTEEDGEKINKYLRFDFGRPSSHSLFYGINKNGDTTIFYNMLSLLRMKECGELYAKNAISLRNFYCIVFGHYKGDFKINTVINMINKAVNNGILIKSGEKTKTTIRLANGKVSPNPYKNNIALKSLAINKEYKTGRRKNKSIVRFGDFKLIQVAEQYGDDDDILKTVKKFTLQLASYVVGGMGKNLDFKLITTHRNTLVIMIGEDEEIDKDWFQADEDINFDFVQKDENIKDTDLLHLYRNSVNTKARDFVFIVGLENVNYEEYTFPAFVKELTRTADKKHFVCISQVDELPDDYYNNIPRQTHWWIKHYSQSLTVSELREIYRNCPDIYEFGAEDEQGNEFLSWFAATTESCEEIDADDKNIYRIIDKCGFYRVWTPRKNIELSDRDIIFAKRRGFIEEKYQKGDKGKIRYIRFIKNNN